MKQDVTDLLNKKLESAINNGRVEEAEYIVDELLKDEKINPTMPQNFVSNIAFKSKKRGRNMKTKYIKVAAAMPFIQKNSEEVGGAIVFTDPTTEESPSIDFVVTDNSDTTFDSTKLYEEEDAFSQADIPYILPATFMDGYKLSGNQSSSYKCYSTIDKTITSTAVRGVYVMADKKCILDIDKSLDGKDSNTINVVINGIYTDDYRTYTTKDNVVYALQDIIDEGDEHVSATLLSGEYSMSLKFYNMDKREIEAVLDSLQVTNFSAD